MRILFYTLGCKANQSESASLADILAKGGHTIVSDGCIPDAVVINTCTVTQTSDQKSRQAVRRFTRLYPDAVIAVCGCMSQMGAEETAKLGAHLVSGTSDRLGFLRRLEQIMDGRGAHCASVNTHPASADNSTKTDAQCAPLCFEPLPPAKGSRTRCFLKIQDGCDNHCTYCVIPHARGASRSLPPEEVYKSTLGIDSREIVITGIEISSYGADLGDVTLANAIKAVRRAAPQSRIRLGSLEPRSITEEFLDALAGLPVCPHFHLSLQSGCDATLRRMGRRYDTARFVKSCELVRAYYPGCAITTDLITGFPGETEDDHAQTLEFIKHCGFAAMHVFPYSVRKGTPAAKLPEQLVRAVKQKRAGEAAAIGRQMSEDYMRTQLGRTLSVLFESAEHGKSENYMDVNCSGESFPTETQETHVMCPRKGEIHDVHIEAIDGNILLGRL